MSSKTESPWRDEETLRELYVSQRLTTDKIAEELGCSNGTVSRWLNKHGIETRDPAEWFARKPITLSTRKDGYVSWRYTVGGRGGEDHHIFVHQLLAVANGCDPRDAFDPSVHIHHQNGIPWDNRTDNLDVLTAAEHRSDHLGVKNAPWRDRERLANAYEDHTIFEIADRWECSPHTISAWLERHGISTGRNGMRSGSDGDRPEHTQRSAREQAGAGVARASDQEDATDA